MRRVLLAAAGIALAILALGCGAGASTTDTAPPGRVNTDPVTVAAGTPVQYIEYAGDRNVSTITVSNPGTARAGQFEKPRQHTFYVADVTMNVTQGEFSASTGQFKFVDAGGNVYETTYCEAGEPYFAALSLTAGQTKTGKLCFDVPENAWVGGKIALGSALTKGDVAYWTLPN